MTLDEFMDRGLKSLRDSPQVLRKHVKQPGYLFLYLRLHRGEDGPILDVANVTVMLAERGRGLFTKTLRHIKYKYPEVSIRVENVTQERFRQHLLKLGFDICDPQNLFLSAQKDMPSLR